MLKKRWVVELCDVYRWNDIIKLSDLSVMLERTLTITDYPPERRNKQRHLYCMQYHRHSDNICRCLWMWRRRRRNKKKLAHKCGFIHSVLFFRLLSRTVTHSISCCIEQLNEHTRLKSISKFNYQKIVVSTEKERERWKIRPLSHRNVHQPNKTQTNKPKTMCIESNYTTPQLNGVIYFSSSMW